MIIVILIYIYIYIYICFGKYMCVYIYIYIHILDKVPVVLHVLVISVLNAVYRRITTRSYIKWQKDNNKRWNIIMIRIITVKRQDKETNKFDLIITCYTIMIRRITFKKEKKETKRRSLETKAKKSEAVVTEGSWSSSKWMIMISNKKNKENEQRKEEILRMKEMKEKGSQSNSRSGRITARSASTRTRWSSSASFSRLPAVKSISCLRNSSIPDPR